MPEQINGEKNGIDKNYSSSDEFVYKKPEDICAAGVDITPDKDDGVIKEVIKEGNDSFYPGNGCKVFVDYVGFLADDGSKFDSSLERGEPFSFVLGPKQVIDGWHLCIPTMKIGEICQIYCKPNYAYGKNGMPPKIKPMSSLVFTIKMIKWDFADLAPKRDNVDGHIIKKILAHGTGKSTPNEFSPVTVSVIGKNDGKVFDERKLDLCIGEETAFNLPSGLKYALESMRLGEKALVEISPEYGFKSGEARPEWNISEDAKIEYTVTMEHFDKIEAHYNVSPDRAIELAQYLKDKGVKYYRDNNFELALNFFLKMQDYLKYEGGELGEKVKPLKLSCYLNAAQCYMKLERYLEAIDNSTLALSCEENNIKALYRRGMAHLSLFEPEKARDDFSRILKLDPSEKLVQKNYAQALKMIKQHKEKEKQVYRNMFDKFATQDKLSGKDWRFGWWDGEKKKIQVDKMEEPEEVEEEEDEVKRNLKLKKKFIEDRARMLEEKRKQIIGDKDGDNLQQTTYGESNVDKIPDKVAAEENLPDSENKENNTDCPKEISEDKLEKKD